MDPGTDIHTLLVQKRDEILALAHRRGARDVRVLGSVARKETREDSDLDLLIDPDPDRSPRVLSTFLCGASCGNFI